MPARRSLTLFISVLITVTGICGMWAFAAADFRVDQGGAVVAHSFTATSQPGFGQVKLVSSTLDSVPVGKIWQIVSYWQSDVSFSNQAESGSCLEAGQHHAFLVNGERYWAMTAPATGLTTGVWLANGGTFPIWLPEGSTLQTECSGDFLSVIEYAAP